MRIEIRDEQRRRIGRARVDPAERPVRVRLEDGGGEVFLDWDAALDDARHLRRCVVCGCRDLYRDKAFPQITLFVVVLAFAGAVVGILGLATTPPILVAMVLVLVADVSILVLARQRLVCHGCRSSYHELPIARYHRRWDRSVAERYPPPGMPRVHLPWRTLRSPRGPAPRRAAAATGARRPAARGEGAPP